MSKKSGGFNGAAKARISGAESRQHGHIRPGSFASKVQSRVDSAAAAPCPAAPAPVKK